MVGYQYQDNTVLRFKRKINTCDGEDLAITVNKNSFFNVYEENRYDCYPVAAFFRCLYEKCKLRIEAQVVPN